MNLFLLSAQRVRDGHTELRLLVEAVGQASVVGVREVQTAVGAALAVLRIESQIDLVSYSYIAIYIDLYSLFSQLSSLFSYLFSYL